MKYTTSSITLKVDAGLCFDHLFPIGRSAISKLGPRSLHGNGCWCGRNELRIRQTQVSADVLLLIGLIKLVGEMKNRTNSDKATLNVLSF
jgi:hypothetical protein